MRMKLKVLAMAGVILTGVTACATEEQETTSSPEPSSESFAYICQEDLKNNEPLTSTGLPENVGYTDSPTGFEVPISDTGGGCETLSSGTKAGFARTETGAALAALNAALGYHPGASQAMFDEAEAKISRSNHWDQMIAGSQEYLQSGGELPSPSQVKATGFTVTSYTPHEASVIVYLKPVNGIQSYAMNIKLVWEKDWKIVTGPSSFYLDTATSTDTPRFTYER